MQFLIEPPDHPYAREVHCQKLKSQNSALMRLARVVVKQKHERSWRLLGQQNWVVCMDLVQCGACGHVFYANPPDEKWFEKFLSQ